MKNRRLHLGLLLLSAGVLLLHGQASAMTIKNLDKAHRRVATSCTQKAATPGDEYSNCSYCYTIETIIKPGGSRSYQCGGEGTFTVRLKKQVLEVKPLSSVIIRGSKLHIQ